MRVDTGRWGEVTIKRQGNKKNKFDKTRSFSIMNTKHEYTIDQLYKIYTVITDLTEEYEFKKLKNELMNIKEKTGEK